MMIKLNMYAIYSESKSCWFNVESETWVDQFELEGGFLFPTFNMAQKYIKDTFQNASAEIYKVELTTHSYEFFTLPL